MTAPAAKTQANTRVLPAGLRQAAVIKSIVDIARVGRSGVREPVATPDGVAVISQTCDLVDSESCTVVKIVTLGGSDAVAAREGQRPRFVALPALGDEFFIDLKVVGCVWIEELTRRTIVPGVSTPSEARRFGQLVGRCFARFPFPDEVVPWFKPLKKVATEKYDKPQSDLGVAFSKVVEFRVEALGEEPWSEPPYTLRLVVVLEVGEFPTFPDDFLPEISPELEAELRPPGKTLTPAQIARILAEHDDPTARYFTWMALGDAFAAMCRPTQATARQAGLSLEVVQQAVLDEVSGEVLSADDFGLDRVRNSELLDLEHLSAPLAGPPLASEERRASRQRDKGWLGKLLPRRGGG